MTGMWRVFRRELIYNFKRKGYLFATLGVPLLMLALFYGYSWYTQRQASQPAEPASQAIQPPTGVNLPSGLQPSKGGVIDKAGLLKPPITSTLTLFASEQDAQQAIQDGRIGYYYVIPADYLKGANVEMYFARTALPEEGDRPIEVLLTSALQDLTEKPLTNIELKRLQGKATVNSHIIGDSGTTRRSDSDTNFGVVYIFALALMFCGFTTSGYLLQSIVEEKETRMVEMLLSSVRPRDLLFGKILALSLLGLLQMTLWLGTMIFLITRIANSQLSMFANMANFTLSAGQIITLVIFFLLGYLLYAAGFALIGAIANTMREGPQLAAFITVPSVIPLYAISLFAASPDGPLPTALSIFPLTAPLSMVMRATVTYVPWLQVLVSAILLGATVLLLMWLAGRAFRVNVLLAGQTPKLRDLLRIVMERA